MELGATYLGLKLKHPLMPGASPMAGNLDTVRTLEDAGASAIVMNSLFEEQIVREQVATAEAYDELSHAFAEAMTFMADSAEFEVGPEEYLEQVQRIKQAVDVPVIASLNGTTEGGWLKYGRMIEQAGADALELNVYDIETDIDVTGESVEQRTADVVKALRSEIEIPFAVKLSPFYASLPNVARRLENAGADGLVIFNRFYQPDIDVEELEMFTVNLSGRDELPLRLRWLGILWGNVGVSLAATGGAHSAIDVIKSVMCGADAVQMVSALLRLGPQHLKSVLAEMKLWLEEHEYQSLEQLKGSMSLLRCPDPKAYERANYIRVLQSWS